jgi:prolyl oligopeptidase
MLTSAKSAVVLLALAVSATAGPINYPPARRDAQTDDYNGVEVPDPYRWLEQLDSPETRSWVKAQAQLADSYLDKIPTRKNIQRRLAELLDFEKYGIPFHRGTRYFYTFNKGLQPQSVLYSTVGLGGEPAVVFDPNVTSTNGALGVAGYDASPDGSILAYGISPGGSDWVDWHFRDVAAGRDLPDVVRWTKYYRPVFTRDGKGVFYSAFSAPAPGEELLARDLGNAVFYHAFGTAPAADRLVYRRDDHPDWQFEPRISHDGRWLILRAGEGEVGDKGVENVYVLDPGAANATVAPLIEGFDAGYVFIGADAGRLYFQTTLNAPRGRVVAIDPAAPERSRWQEIIPQRADAMDADGSVSLVDHQFIVRTLHDAHGKVEIYGLDRQLRRTLALPGPGTVGGFDGEPDDRETFYSYTDATTPPVIFRLDVETGRISVSGRVKKRVREQEMPASVAPEHFQT